MAFSKSFPKTKDKYPVWEEVYLSKDEEIEEEKRARGENVNLMKDCLKDARQVLKQENIKEEVVRQIRKEIGPIATPKEVYLVKDLPKTRSGKIMRRILRKLFTSEELGDLSALSNPESVEEIKLILR